MRLLSAAALANSKLLWPAPLVGVVVVTRGVRSSKSCMSDARPSRVAPTLLPATAPIFGEKKNHHRRVRIWHGSTLRSTHPSIPRAREFWPQAREELGGWGELFFVGTHLTGKKSGTITMGIFPRLWFCGGIFMVFLVSQQDAFPLTFLVIWKFFFFFKCGNSSFI